MTRIVVVGAGGHGREVADLLRARQAAGGPAPAGFVDDDPSTHGRIVAGLPVLGNLDWFRRNREDVAAVIAVGSPPAMKKLSSAVEALGIPVESAVWPGAVVSTGARLGRGVLLFEYTAVHAGASLGDHVTLNVGATVSHDAEVGSFCNLNPGVRLAGNVKLGQGCFVGMGAMIIQGIRVGAGATIGAGAVVIRDVPENATVAGVPARPLAP